MTAAVLGAMVTATVSIGGSGNAGTGLLTTAAPVATGSVYVAPAGCSATWVPRTLFISEAKTAGLTGSTSRTNRGCLPSRGGRTKASRTRTGPETFSTSRIVPGLYGA